MQPSAAYQGAAAFALTVLGVLLAAALAVAWRGREATVDFSHETRGPGRTERERVRAEMQIARRARLEMLPPASPALERYAISAACEPAREVGGDLYDFVDLPDGCLGIAVGDVSGKGMGAAYYMALTKGLLLGAAEDRLDPGITEAMNRRDEEYGDDRLRATVARTDGLSAEAARDLILADVAAFVGDAPSYDDITLVVIRAL